MEFVFERVASTVERLAAAAIDLAVSVVLGIVSGLIIKAADAVTGNGILTIILLIFLFFTAKDIAGGRSIGKRILNLAVRNAKDPETIPGIFREILRNTGILIAPVEIIIMLADRNNNRMGDYIFNTVCVRLGEDSGKNSERLERYREKFNEEKARRKNIRKAYAISVICLCAALLFSTSIVFLVRGIILNSKAYETAVNAIETNPLVERTAGDVDGYGFMPVGSLSVRNGYGYASWTIKVRGEERNVSIHIRMTKDRGGQWIVKELILED